MCNVLASLNRQLYDVLTCLDVDVSAWKCKRRAAVVREEMTRERRANP